MSEPQPPAIPPERPSQSAVSLDGAQTGDVSFGDVAGRDINKTTIINQARLSPEERQAQRNRAALIGLVRRFWVEGVLHESLHQRVRIELGMQAQPDAVDQPWHNIVRLPGQASRPLAPGQSISAVFAQAGERLLILGAPGGGKTTTLLTLAEQLLGAAEGDDFLPIPVVFQLSTWVVTQPALSNWLVSELKERYHVPLKVGKAWVEAGEILPLLDGLDEVGPADADRVACVQAINAYLGEAGAQAVVCSRSAEYVQAGERLALKSAIEVQPLGAGQVDSYLAQLGPALAGLRATIASDTTLADLATSPLLLSVMALAYRDLPATDLVGQGEQQAYRRLWDDYLANRFALMRGDAKTNPTQLRAWLIWLAQGMIVHGQQTFYIEYLQPSWLATKWQRRLFHILSTLFLGLVGGLSFGLVGGLFIGLIAGLYFGPLFSRGGITLPKTLFWDAERLRGWPLRRDEMGTILVFFLGIGLVGGLFFSLVGGLIVGLVGGLAVGLFSGLFVNLLFVLAQGLVEGDEIQIGTRPNEGIWRSQHGMIIGALIGGLIGAVMGGLYEFLIAGFVMGVIGGLVPFGGEVVTKHLILRLLLRFHCDAPWNFAAALDEAVSRTLMTRVGGGYRFYHRLLQEHFAEHAQSELPVAPILGPQPGERSGGRRQEAGGKD